MTIQELYEKIGGNYDHAVQIMRMDKMISKYLLKLKGSGVYEDCMAAFESMDGQKIFESTHAMKGVCANLGLDDLAAAVSEITEEFRPESERRLSDDELNEKIQTVIALYEKTAEGISEYEAGL